MIKRRMKNYSHLFFAFGHSLLIFVFFVVACQNVSATTYYVDSDALDEGGDGKTKPWNSLQQVNDAMATFIAGDHIQFKRGSIFYGVNLDDRRLSITASGTAGNPIVFESYGDPNEPLPAIDGSQELNSWTDGGNGIWSHAYPLLDPDHRPNILHYNGVPKPPITTLKFDSVPATLQENAILLQPTSGFLTLWVKSVNSGTNTVSGITFSGINDDDVVLARQLDASGRQIDLPESPLSKPTIIVTTDGLTEAGHWYWGANKIYLKSAVSPVGKVQVGYVGDYSGFTSPEEVQFACIDIVADYVTIKDLKIQKCNEWGITIRNANHATVSGMDISGCGIGGIALRNASNNMINENTLNNTGGINVWAYPGPSWLSVNNDIVNNTLSNCRGTCIALSTEGAPADPAEVSGNRIVGNTVNRANTMIYDSAGIYTWNAGSNTIESNVIKNGGSMYLRSAGIMIDIGGAPMTISKNIIENNSQGGVAVTGAGHKIIDNILRNNGVASWASSQVLFFAAGGKAAANCTVTGNTMEADQDHHFILGWPGSQSGHFIDNNVYSSPSTKLFSWGSSWSEEWVSFKRWRCDTGHDMSSTLNGVTYSPDVRSCFRLSLFMSAILSGAIGNS